MAFTFGLIGFVLTLYVYVTYIVQAVKKILTPHLFTFIPATIVSGIVTIAQINNYAGWSTWISGVTTISCVAILAISPWYGERNITRFDIVSLVACFVAIILWIITKNDLVAIIFSCIANTLAFLPTTRKIYFQPRTESSHLYFISSLRAVLAIFSVQNFILVNWLYPVYLVIHNLFLAFFRIARIKTLETKNIHN